MDNKLSNVSWTVNNCMELLTSLQGCFYISVCTKPEKCKIPHRAMFRPCLPSGRWRCSKLRFPNMRTVGLYHRGASGITAVQSTRRQPERHRRHPQTWALRAERRQLQQMGKPCSYPPQDGIRTSSTGNITPVKAAPSKKIHLPGEPFKLSCNMVKDSRSWFSDKRSRQTVTLCTLQ